jgi:putative ABC transport system permease protein
MFFKLALRNLLRNRRRTLVTVLAIAAGFAAINLFGGYVANVFGGLQRQAIHGETLGHLTVTRPGFFQQGKIRQEDFLIEAPEIERLTALMMTTGAIDFVSPRLSLSGLVSDGSTSTIFIADAIVRTDLSKIRQDFRPERGGFLDPDNAVGIVLAENLASALSMSKGSTGVLFTSTLTGQANALDFDVVDVYDTGNASTNDKAILLPLDMARELLQTEGAERLTLMLKDATQTRQVQQQLTSLFQAQGLNFEVHNWEQLSAFYSQVKGLFNMIFSFIFAIVSVIVVMSIINTMSMIIVERTREIGTLRSLGMQKYHVLQMFCLEGFLIGLAGCGLGLLITVLVGSLINATGFSYIPPNSSSPVPLLVNFELMMMLATLAALSVFTVVSSLVPARRAASAEITDALRHI